jgi:hypothetical protein
LPSRYQTAIPKAAEVVRSVGLREIRFPENLRDGERTLAQRDQNAQPRWVAKAAQELGLQVNGLRIGIQEHGFLQHIIISAGDDIITTTVRHVNRLRSQATPPSENQDWDRRAWHRIGSNTTIMSRSHSTLRIDEFSLRRYNSTVIELVSGMIRSV